jgi:FAD/FMN-containing dehydrogenase
MQPEAKMSRTVYSAIPVSGTVDVAAAQAFQTTLRGDLLRPGEAAYEATRRVWNGMIDRRPALIVRCRDAHDVVRTVNFARQHGLLVSIRGGDHSLPGHAVCDGGLMIDLSLMKGISVNPVARTARVEPGLRWAEVDAETQRYGLATTGGTIGDTGVAGLTLGGGLGWLAGRYGLTCDNLLAADVVTADGQLWRASPAENPDLFWAIRGGGGNFGVVTAFEFRLHPVGPIVTGGMVVHPLARAAEALRFYRDFTASNPDEVNTVCAILTTPEGIQVVAIAACHCGSPDEGEQVLRPLKEFGPPVLDQIGPVPYVALQSALDPTFPRGRRYYVKSSFLRDLQDGLIDRMAAQYATVPSPHTVFLLQQLGKAANRVAPDATAFSHRNAHWDAVVFSGWDDPVQDAEQVAWTRQVHASWRPFSTGGVYSNAGAENDAEVRAAYGAAYDRLARLKARYDPDNFFRLNANIPPAGPTSGGPDLDR